jgi:hypothetical protein
MFRQGELERLILGALRDAEEPLSPREGLPRVRGDTYCGAREGDLDRERKERALELAVA